MTAPHRGAHHADQQHHQEHVGARRRRGRLSWGDHGASAVEYALILVACALGLVVAGFALQNSLGSALERSAGAIESGAANAGCSADSDGDNDGGSCADDGDGDGSGDGSDDGSESTPTQPAGSTAIAPGSNATFTSGVASGYSLATPTSTACTFSPSIKPSGTTVTVSETKSGSTSQSLKFAVGSGATHYQAVTATCTFKKGSSTTTKSYSVWIS